MIDVLYNLAWLWRQVSGGLILQRSMGGPIRGDKNDHEVVYRATREQESSYDPKTSTVKAFNLGLEHNRQVTIHSCTQNENRTATLNSPRLINGKTINTILKEWEEMDHKKKQRKSSKINQHNDKTSNEGRDRRNSLPSPSLTEVRTPKNPQVEKKSSFRSPKSAERKGLTLRFATEEAQIVGTSAKYDETSDSVPKSPETAVESKATRDISRIIADVDDIVIHDSTEDKKESTTQGSEIERHQAIALESEIVNHSIDTQPATNPAATRNNTFRWAQRGVTRYTSKFSPSTSSFLDKTTNLFALANSRKAKILFRQVQDCMMVFVRIRRRPKMTIRAETNFASEVGGKEPNKPELDSSSDDEDTKFVTKCRICHIIIENSNWCSRRMELAHNWLSETSKREASLKKMITYIFRYSNSDRRPMPPSLLISTRLCRRRQARKDDPRLLVLAAAQAKWPETEEGEEVFLRLDLIIAEHIYCKVKLGASNYKTLQKRSLHSFWGVIQLQDSTEEKMILLSDEYCYAFVYLANNSSLKIATTLAAVPSKSETSIPTIYNEYKDVSSDGLRELPEHGIQDFSIELKDGKIPPFSPLYNSAYSSKIFTTLDLKDAYWLCRIRLGDEWKTAFRTCFGMFDETEEAHVDHVHKVLQRCREHALPINLKKCRFHQESVEFLGYRINSTGVHMIEDRVARIVDWEAPRDLKALQLFLGLCNFYRSFIKDYSLIVSTP
ncbi:hypothetical protein PROFUN_00030 [Planoprotostelium fungivorum]|uniref:Uncharacterized protein n=1 Tax=Planoprotostelium fungivorum TaxID=1890364 RepID=A0A2P6P0H8_9EUKA|nr:hypothetical protein PROFUN_00030 [Planoprotostelium fungivorum]